MTTDMQNRLLDLARHIVVMANDAYLTSHPEWLEIVKEADRALGDADQEAQP